MAELGDMLAVARGDAPADLVFHHARIVNVFSGLIEEGDVAVHAGRIAGVGPTYRGREEVDLRGAFLVPGLIDAHVHIESSLCLPPQFAATVLPHGITCAVIDPHEIANVAGLAGVRYMIQAARGLPLTVRVMASSCVPATSMETSGARLEADDLAGLLSEPEVLGLAEVMSYPGVIQGDPGVLAKILAFAGRPIDGHLPGVSSYALNAYCAAGIGSEHECVSVPEAQEKLARGLYILIREATNARNLHALLPMVTPENSRRICFCTDDRVPADLLDDGSIDMMVREAIHFGIDPVTAVRMATLNPCEWFGLRERGAIAPGRVADFVVVDDLSDFVVRQVYANGRLVAENGVMVAGMIPDAPPLPAEVAGRVEVDWAKVDLRVPASGNRLRVIGALEGQLITEEKLFEPTVRDGEVVADIERDILKMAVLERHHASGAQAVGFIHGFGLQRGAIAGTVAHDHHNLLLIGADDRSMLTAARALASIGGGLAVADGDEVVAVLPLPCAGLMSDAPVREVRAGYDALVAAARARGCELHDPFMAMSFKALEVIPKLKLTDKGLVDVEKFAFVELFE